MFKTLGWILETPTAQRMFHTADVEMYQYCQSSLSDPSTRYLPDFWIENSWTPLRATRTWPMSAHFGPWVPEQRLGLPPGSNYRLVTLETFGTVGDGKYRMISEKHGDGVHHNVGVFPSNLRIAPTVRSREARVRRWSVSTNIFSMPPPGFTIPCVCLIHLEVYFYPSIGG